MEKKVFVLGLPGSGKSTAARYIEMLARDGGWIPKRYNDYNILFEMFRTDINDERFSSTKNGGFDIHELIVFDEALIEVEKEVLQRKKVHDDQNELIIIEFARDDYCRALDLFSPAFLQNACFLFLDTDIPTCIKRIKDRVADPQTPDDHDVSDYIFESYYQNDNRQYQTSITSMLNGYHDGNEDPVLVIDNTSTTSLRCFLENIKPWIIAILQQQPLFSAPAAVNNPPKG